MFLKIFEYFSGELKTIQFYYFYTFINSISIWNYSTKNIKYCYYIFLIIQKGELSEN